MINEFFDLVGILKVNRKNLVELAVDNGAVRHNEALFGHIVGIGREVAVAEQVLVGKASADLVPVFVVGLHCHQVRIVDFVDEADRGLSHIAQEVHPNLVDHDALGTCVAHVNRAGNAANQIVRVGVLAADDSVDLNDFALEVQAFEIVSNAQKVDFRRKFVAGVAPVSVSKNTELAAGDECFQAVLNFFEVSRRGESMRGDGLLDFAGLLRIGAQSGDDVNPVAAVELIEVSQVVLAVQRSVHQVADDVSVLRNLDSESVFNRANGRQSMNTGADAADAFHKGPCITGVASLQNDFKTAPHRAG